MSTTAISTDDVESEVTGASNPYALAEFISGRTIDWTTEPEPARLLEEILVTPYEELFDPKFNSPLYMGLRLSEGTLERVRPAVLEIPPASSASATSDAERFEFADVRRLKKIGDLGQYFDARDVSEIPIERATYVDGGVLRLEIAHAGESHLERLARVFTPAVVAHMVPIEGAPLNTTGFASEPATTYWGDHGTFFNHTAEFSDPIQGTIADCYLISAMSAVAWSQPYRISHQTRASGGSQHQFVNSVRLMDTTTEQVHGVEVSSAIPLRFSNNEPPYARSSETGESWPSILEKAYAKFVTGHQGDTPDVPSLAYGSGSFACSRLTGWPRWSVLTKDTSVEELWDLLQQNSLFHKTLTPMVAATYKTGDASPDNVVYADANLAANHYYTVLGWDYVDNKRYIVLRNPYGRTEATLGNLHGSVTFYDLSWWRSINLATDDGVFGLELGVFKQYFARLGGAK